MFTRTIRSMVAAAMPILSTNHHALPPEYELQGGFGGIVVGPGGVDCKVYPMALFHRI